MKWIPYEFITHNNFKKSSLSILIGLFSNIPELFNISFIFILNGFYVVGYWWFSSSTESSSSSSLFFLSFFSFFSFFYYPLSYSSSINVEINYLILLLISVLSPSYSIILKLCSNVFKTDLFLNTADNCLFFLLKHILNKPSHST